MKKVLSLFLATTLAFSLISCGSKPAPEESETPAAPEVTEPAEEVTQKVDNSAEDEAAKKAAEDEAARKAAEDEAARKAAEEEAARKAKEYEEAKANAREARDAAVEAKKNADSVKAGVARKDEYKAYAKLIQDGDNHFVTKAPDKAYESYKEAKEKFEALFNDVSEKRAEAQRRIEEAKAKVKDVEQFAGEADDVAPLGEEKVDGIEEKDAVLLEEETFANPEDAVIDVDDTVKVENDSAVEVFKEAVGVEDK